MNTALLKELCPSFLEIISTRTWEIIKEERSDSFDNAMVELVCDDFAARILRDRGIVSIELASLEKRKWTDLETILLYLGEAVESRNADDLSKLLSKNFGKISALLTSNTAGLQAFAKDRSAKFIDQIFPHKKLRIDHSVNRK